LSRPQPKNGFGTSSPEYPPQNDVRRSGTAPISSSCSVRSTSPSRSGAADHRSAIAPATWGAAPEVPLKDEVYPLPGAAVRSETPGAVRSGLMRSDPSAATGPTLENAASVSSTDVAPTLSEAA